MIRWTQEQVEYLQLHQGCKKKPGTLEERSARGWVETKLAVLLSPCNLGSTLFPLYELQHWMSDLMPVLAWIPGVILLKDGVTWFLQKTS